MSIQHNIKEEAKRAMVARDQVLLTTLRGLSAAFVNELVAKKRRPDEELSDEEALAVISRAVKQRRDSIEQFLKGGREDLANGEKAELAILETYLPAQMSREEIQKYIETKQRELSVDPAKKNQFMGQIMKDLKGRADGNIVRDVVNTIFN